MERYHPRLGAATVAIAGVVTVFTLLNVIFGPWPGHLSEKMYGLPLMMEILGIETSQPAFGPTGVWSGQDFMLLGIAAVSFVISMWARRLRPEMVVPEGVRVESQLESREIGSTSVGIMAAKTSNPRTASIVDNIIGQAAEIQKESVSGAIGALSKGDFGAAAAQEAMTKAPVHGKMIPIPTETIALPDSESHPPISSTSFSTIPLPSLEEDAVELPSIPQGEEDEVVVADEGTVVDAVVDAVADAVVEIPSMVDLPALPAFEKVTDHQNAPSPHVELPNIPSVESKVAEVAVVLPEIPDLPTLPE